MAVSPLIGTAQSLDAKALVVLASDLGSEWQLANGSGDSKLYDTLFVNGSAQSRTRAAEFSVSVGSDEQLARLLLAEQVGAEQDLGYRIESLSPNLLGDGPSVRGSKSTSQAAGVGYGFRVGLVALWVGVAGVPGQQPADVASQALRFAQLQETRVRSALGGPPPTAVVGVSTPTPAPVPIAISAPTVTSTLPGVDQVTFCVTGQTPVFSAGIAALEDQLGETIGQPVECEHPDSTSGDTLQKTTTGLAVFRKSANVPTFTDGSTHWALTPDGLQIWSTDSLDPPIEPIP